MNDGRKNRHSDERLDNTDRLDDLNAGPILTADEKMTGSKLLVVVGLYLMTLLSSYGIGLSLGLLLHYLGVF